MRNIAFPAAAALALAGQLTAGGFWLQLGTPEANPEARKHNAVLVVKATGCADPAAASITATAIGTLDGRRQTIALKTVPLSEPGAFAIAGEWPKAGRWVIQLVGRSGQLFTNTLVPAGPNGLDRFHAKSDMKQFPAGEVEAMLAGAATP
jgi:hypothetical protein